MADFDERNIDAWLDSLNSGLEHDDLRQMASEMDVLNLTRNSNGVLELFKRLRNDDVFKIEKLKDFLKTETGINKTALKPLIRKAQRESRQEYEDEQPGREFGADIRQTDDITEIMIFDQRTNEISKRIPIKYRILGKYFNYNYKSWHFRCKRFDNKNTVLSSVDLNDIMRQAGASYRDIDKFNNFIIKSNEIEEIDTVSNYEYDPHLNKILIPHDYVSSNMIGWGVEFYEKFNSSNENLELAKETYINVLNAARNGIGDTEALMIAAHAIAAPFQREFKKTERIVSQLLLVGKRDTAKSTAAEYLANIAKYPCLHKQEELTSAILSQIGSSAAIPVVIDDIDDLKPGIRNTLKVVLTSTTKRRRSTKNGKRRDAAEFVRTIITTANHIPPYLEDLPALLDRTVILRMNEEPDNFDEWKSAQDEFDKCDQSILNYMAHQDWDWRRLIRETRNEATGFTRPRKRGIYSYFLFGLKILRKLGVQFEDSVKENIKNIILKSNKRGSKDIVAEIIGFLDDAAMRLEKYNRMKDGHDDVRNDILERFMDTGLCEIKKISESGDENDEKYHFIVDDRLFRSIGREIDAKLDKQSELKQILEAGGIKCFTKRIHINHLQRTAYCLCVECPDDSGLSIAPDDEETQRDGKRIIIRQNKNRKTEIKLKSESEIEEELTKYIQEEEAATVSEITAKFKDTFDKNEEELRKITENWIRKNKGEIMYDADYEDNAGLIWII